MSWAVTLGLLAGEVLAYMIAQIAQAENEEGAGAHE